MSNYKSFEIRRFLERKDLNLLFFAIERYKALFIVLFKFFWGRPPDNKLNGI